ncbi:Na+/H+ antiporter NhaC [Eubacteriales bacterium KG127]
METKTKRTPRLPKVWEALMTLMVLIAIMAVGIIVFEADPHIPMFIGVVAAAIMALYLGYDWETIENSMKDGIYRALQSIMILAIIGILIGVWLVAGVVPTMIFYGLKILSPSIFLIAAVLICSITSLATGTSWGTMGTMGLALIGIAQGIGIPAPVAAGAAISGAYFGDKMSPLSDTTNLAPAMAGTDVFTHVKFMALPTLVAYVIALVSFGIMGLSYSSDGTSDVSQINIMSNGLDGIFNINPLLLLPPIIVIVAVAMKIPAIPGITLGIIAGFILGLIFQKDASLGAFLESGMNGFKSKTGVESLDNLLSTGGLMNMMSSISLTILAMMFGGIMEATHQLEVIVDKLLKLVKNGPSLILLTLGTCVASNITMPEQYISIVVPGRMYAETYKKAELHPKTLSNALEGAGTVTSALISWNTCGVFIATTLGVTVKEYGMYAVFNYTMPIVVLIMAFFGLTLAGKDGKRMTNASDRTALAMRLKQISEEESVEFIKEDVAYETVEIDKKTGATKEETRRKNNARVSW